MKINSSFRITRRLLTAVGLLILLSMAGCLYAPKNPGGDRIYGRVIARETGGPVKNVGVALLKGSRGLNPLSLTDFSLVDKSVTTADGSFDLNAKGGLCFLIRVYNEKGNEINAMPVDQEALRSEGSWQIDIAVNSRDLP